MTRINLVDPNMLTDKHLLAEYRELPRVFTAVKTAIAKGNCPADYNIPQRYKLGTGHVTFFYNKCTWLASRYCQIVAVLKDRGYSLDSTLWQSVLNEHNKQITDAWKQPYAPQPEDIYLNMARLTKRSQLDNVLMELRSDA